MTFTRLAIAPMAVTVLIMTAALPSPAFGQPIRPEMETAIFNWTNTARQMQSKVPLRYNERLANAALRHAANMAMQDKMSHTLDDETVVDRARRSLYFSPFVGENIAYNFGYQYPAWQLFDGWMKSPGHHANIMNDQYTEIGVGVVGTHGGKYFACQVFGSPQPNAIPYVVPYAPVQTRTSPNWLSTPRPSDFHWYYIPSWN